MATAVGEAAVILMATPLLIDRVVSTQNFNRKGSWVRRQICESLTLSICKSITIITIQMAFINKGISRHTNLYKCLFGFHLYYHSLWFSHFMSLLRLPDWFCFFWFGPTTFNPRLSGLSIGLSRGRSWVQLRPDQHSGSLNNWGESAAFVMTSANVRLSSLLG